jgi:hypothetical protein
MKRLIYLLFLFPYFAFSQITPQEEPKTTESVAKDVEFWTNYNMEYYLKGGSFLFAETNLLNSTYSYINNLDNIPFYKIQQKIGYEQYLDKNWSLGVSALGVFDKNETQLITQMYAYHVSNISKKNIQLIKNLGFERIDFTTDFKKAESRITLGLALAKNFSIHGKNRFRAMISYKLFMQQYWLLKTHSLYNRRTIDMSRLRIELAYFLRDNLTISLFYNDQVEYYVAEAEYDANQNEITPIRNLNITTPIIGFRVHLQIFNKQKPENIRLRFLNY